MKLQQLILASLVSACACAHAETVTISNDFLTVAFDASDAAIGVTCRKSGCVRKSMRDEGSRMNVKSVSSNDGEINFDFETEAVKSPLRGRIRLEKNEMVVSITGDASVPMKGSIRYPYPFEAQRGERVLIPSGCGYAFPVEMKDLGTKAFDCMQFWTRDMKMGMWGQYGETTAPDGEQLPKNGILAIVETPGYAAAEFLVRANALRQMGIVWKTMHGKFGENRTLRYVFEPDGGPIQMAARYRDEMKKREWLVTFNEKKARNPKMSASYDLLAGAPIVWYWEIDGDKPGVARRLKELGFDNFVFSGVTRRDLKVWITPEEVRAIAKIPGVLQTEYDIYTDLMEPAMLDKIDCSRPHWPVEAWDRDDIVRNPDGSPARGWKVALKSDPTKPVIGCASLCEAQAPRYMRERISKRLAEAPYGARFFDVTGTSVGCCFNPKHPLNRYESLVARRKMFALAGEEFNLICGTEDGLECYVPECDYYEGNFTAASLDYRVDAGRYMWKIYDEVPPGIEKAVDASLRVPFWEMVFHDCIVSTWYWTDYNNKFPKQWWKRDLLNAVTGTVPMYFFTKEVFDGIQEKLAESVKITTPVARATFGVQMTEYRWLTPDRLVQQSAFANGVRVTANFSDKPFTMKDGIVVSPRNVRIEPKIVSCPRPQK